MPHFMTGKLKFFDSKKGGFGYVEAADGGRDVRIEAAQRMKAEKTEVNGGWIPGADEHAWGENEFLKPGTEIMYLVYGLDGVKKTAWCAIPDEKPKKQQGRRRQFGKHRSYVPYGMPSTEVPSAAIIDAAKKENSPPLSPAEVAGVSEAPADFQS